MKLRTPTSTECQLVTPPHCSFFDAWWSLHVSARQNKEEEEEDNTFVFHTAIRSSLDGGMQDTEMRFWCLKPTKHADDIMGSTTILYPPRMACDVHRKSCITPEDVIDTIPWVLLSRHDLVIGNAPSMAEWGIRIALEQCALEIHRLAHGPVNLYIYSRQQGVPGPHLMQMYGVHRMLVFLLYARALMVRIRSHHSYKVRLSNQYFRGIKNHEILGPGKAGFRIVVSTVTLSRGYVAIVRVPDRVINIIDRTAVTVTDDDACLVRTNQRHASDISVYIPEQEDNAIQFRPRGALLPPHRYRIVTTPRPRGAPVAASWEGGGSPIPSCRCVTTCTKDGHIHKIQCNGAYGFHASTGCIVTKGTGLCDEACVVRL